MPKVRNPSALADFGRRLAGRRKALGLTQAQLADRLRLANAESVSRYERGEADPKLSTILRLADVLGCGPSTLVPGVAPSQAASALRADAEGLLDSLFDADPAAAELAIGALRGLLEVAVGRTAPAPAPTAPGPPPRTVPPRS